MATTQPTQRSETMTTKEQSWKLDTENAGCDEVLVGSYGECLQDVLNRYELDDLPDGWTLVHEYEWEVS